jgi:hypothetical protein
LREVIDDPLGSIQQVSAAPIHRSSLAFGIPNRWYPEANFLLPTRITKSGDGDIFLTGATSRSGAAIKTLKLLNIFPR